jgi:methyl-accepting chemotaxis protein
MNDSNECLKALEKQRDATNNIKGVAGEINMIAINAAIESAHAASGIRTMMEKTLDGMMTSICRSISFLLEAKALKLDPASLKEFASHIGIDELFITNADGLTVASNLEPAIGWRFPDDPKAQAFVFRSLINSKDGVVTQPITSRDLDSLMFKFVGVSRIDEPGIVQIGLKAETITRFQVEIGSVFGILATEIKNLGSRVTLASKAVQEATSMLEKAI